MSSGKYVVYKNKQKCPLKVRNITADSNPICLPISRGVFARLQPATKLGGNMNQKFIKYVTSHESLQEGLHTRQLKTKLR